MSDTRQDGAKSGTSRIMHRSMQPKEEFCDLGAKEKFVVSDPQNHHARLLIRLHVLQTVYGTIACCTRTNERNHTAPWSLQPSHTTRMLASHCNRALYDLEILGWIGFTASALGYITATNRSDYISLAAGLAFLFGDVCFIIMLFSRPRPPPPPVRSKVLPMQQLLRSTTTCRTSASELEGAPDKSLRTRESPAIAAHADDDHSNRYVMAAA
jgi:hypothetical protein